jgi:hypothetical protein
MHNLKEWLLDLDETLKIGDRELLTIRKDGQHMMSMVSIGFVKWSWVAGMSYIEMFTRKGDYVGSFFPVWTGLTIEVEPW